MISRTEYFNKRGIIENDYLFNYSGLNDKKRKQMNEDMNPNEIYKKLIIREQI